MIREEGVHLSFNYAPGKAAALSFRALQEGRLEGSQCRGCERVAFPASDLCPRCGSSDAEPVTVDSAGTLAAVTFVPGRGNFGLIQLGEATVIHRIVGLAKRGDSVRPTFEIDDQQPLTGFQTEEAEDS